MKSHRLVVFSTAAVLMLAAGIVFAMGILSLPQDPVTVVHRAWPNGDNSTFNIELSNVDPGYDVTNGIYPGWCIESNGQDDKNGEIVLLDSTDTDELVCDENGYPGYPWDKINYLLNHQKGSIKEVQVAMWLLTGRYSGSFGPPTPKAWAMFDKANAKGEGFLPKGGEIAAVVLCADGHTEDGYQDTLIEVEVPPSGDFQACTPGYWKQEQHFLAWVPTEYAQDDIYGDEFGVDDTMNLVLLEALWTGGGHEKALYRHATAGLLNAAHPDVAYQYSVEQVIQMVKDAYSSGNFNQYKDLLEEANEMGCSLDNGDPREPEPEPEPRSRIRRGKGRRN